MIRFATVGTSKITEHFLEAAALVPELEYDASFSRDAAKAAGFAENHGAKRHFSDMLRLAQDSSIDAVYIATPNVFHARQSRLFLENGKHVLCEKPITCTPEEYAGLHALAAKNGLVYMEGMMSVNVPWHSEVSAALGEIGRPALARFDFCQRSSRYDAFCAGIPQNIFDMSLHAGTLMDLGVYCVYAAADMFGAPRSVTARASLFENGADCAGAAIFDYGSFPAVLSYSKAGQSAADSEIIGDCGVLKIASVSQYTGVTIVKNGESRVIVPKMPRREVMRGEAQRFCDMILRKEQNAEYSARLHSLAGTVQCCMAEIKRSAGLIYPEKRN